LKPYYEDGSVTIYHGDCLEILPTLPKVDLVLTDPPYGITSNSWDGMPPEDVAEALRFANTAVITAGQPFSSRMVVEMGERFKHEIVWVKDRGSNFANTVREPMKEHETVLVFSDGPWTYSPQMQARRGAGSERVKYAVKYETSSDNYREFEGRPPQILPNERVPSSVVFFNIARGVHPTQKPLPLFEYLVTTYSNKADTILDPFLGSGTTAVAAKNLGRKCIGIEIEEKYCEIAAKRLAQEVLPGVTA